MRPEVRGALIGDVTPNSPAQKAGLEKGDIILDINGKPVNNSAELRMHVSLMAPGTKVDVKVFRDGAEKTLPLTLAEMPTETARERTAGEQQRRRPARDHGGERHRPDGPAARIAGYRYRSCGDQRGPGQQSCRFRPDSAAT